MCSARPAYRYGFHPLRQGSCASYLLDYRLAPEHTFPAAFGDTLAGYEVLLAEGVQEIIIGGDSAGGGLALALLAEICCIGPPQSKGVFALSPLTDMRFSGASLQENARGCDASGGAGGPHEGHVSAWCGAR